MQITREELTLWILENLRLSGGDRRVFSMIEENISLGRVATNQAHAWDRLIEKYFNQLVKNGINIKDIKPHWQVPVVNTVPYAVLKIVDDDILFRISWDPYLISLFNKLFPATSRIWFKDTGWIIPYTLTNLRVVVQFIQRYVPHCEIESPLKEVVDTMLPLKWREWATMAVPYGSNKMMINCLTEVLTSHLSKSLEMAISNIVALTDLGIEIDPRIKRSLRSQFGRATAKLAYDRKAAFRISEENNDQILQFCKLSGATNVVMASNVESNEIWLSLEHLLKEGGIDIRKKMMASWVIPESAQINQTCDLLIVAMNHQLYRVPGSIRTLKYYQYANL